MSISSAKESLTLLAAIEYFGCIYVDAVAIAWLTVIMLAHAWLTASVQFQTRDRSRSEEIPDRISAGHLSSQLSGYRFINKSFASRNPKFSLVRILR
jgi:hypothetical protein